MKIPKILRMAGISEWLLAVALSSLAACSITPLGDPPGVVIVVLENPGQWQVRILKGDDPVGPVVLASGQAEELQWSMVSGKYRLEIWRDILVGTLPVPALSKIVPSGTLRIRLPEHLPPPVPGWCFIPGGPCLVGDELGIGQEDERPAHLAHVEAFWIGAAEVTNREYCAFLNCAAAIEESWLDFGSHKCRVRRVGSGAGWQTDAPELPVVTVSRIGALAYLEWRSRISGVLHRLPTEAEWEKAARGPNSRIYDYGNEFRRNAANQESGSLSERRAPPVGGFGLSDATGNAFEWVSDPYDPRAYAERIGKTDEPLTDARRNEDSDPSFVLRGGSFVLDGMYLRNSFRMKQRASVRSDDIGFRAVTVGTPPRSGDDR